MPILKYLYRLHYFLVLNIPLIAGVIIVFEDYDSVITYAILGWVIYLVNGVFYKAIYTINDERQSNLKRIARILLFWLPLPLLCFFYGWDALESFFVATGSFECLALALGLIFMFLFGRGVDGSRSFNSLGVGLVVFVIIIFGASGYPFLATFLEYIHNHNQHESMILIAITVYQTILAVSDIKLVRDASKSGAYVENTDKFMYIIVMIFGWIFGLVALQAIVNGLE